MKTIISAKELNRYDRPLERCDREEISETLGQAFADDTAMISLLGEQRWQIIAKQYFRLQLDHSNVILKHTVDGRTTGVALARSLDAPVGWNALISLFGIWWLLGRNFSRSQHISNLVSACLPVSPHWYLNQLAVLPNAQSRGTGSMLLQQIIDLSEGSPVYVDCATELVSFYRRSGFEVVTTLPDYNLVVMATNA